MFGINFVILATETVGLILPIFIIGLIIFLFISKQKNKKNQEEINKLGRKGKKDHAWHILKEYYKECGLQGSRIESILIFERPSSPQQLHEALTKAYIYRARKESKLHKTKYKKPQLPKRFPEEDYFDKLDREIIDSYSSNLNMELNNQTDRKRYIIAHKIMKKQLSPGNLLEVEIVKKTNADGNQESAVVVNKELDFKMEMSGLEPIFDKKLLSKQQESESKKINGYVRLFEFFKKPK